jgi:hypothetical protein
MSRLLPPESAGSSDRLNGDISPDQINGRQRCQQLLALVEVLNAGKTFRIA